MVFNQLEALIKQFPKFQVEFEKFSNKGYKLINININSNSNSVLGTHFKIIMENLNGSQLSITSYKFCYDEFEEIYVEELKSNEELLSQGLRLDPLLIFHKKFKKQLFFGYKIDDVNEYLDTVISDYRYVYDVLLKELDNFKKSK